MKLLLAVVVLFLVGCATVVKSPVVSTEELVAEGVVTQPGAVIALQSYAGSCKDGKRAVMLMSDGGSVAAFIGCWWIEGEFVVSEWEDGDVYRVPVKAHQWVKPASRI